MIEGVRFVESTEAKVFHAPDLYETMRNIPCRVNGYIESEVDGPVSGGMGVGSKHYLSIGRNGKGALAVPQMVGRSILVHDASEDSWQYAEVVGAYSEGGIEELLYLDRPLYKGGQGNVILETTDEDMIYPGEAGLAGRDVYATLVMGDNAYGTTELTGGGLQHIVKQLGSAGTADPLNQRATVGWKATKAAVRLVEAFMVRIETASTFEVGEN